MASKHSFFASPAWAAWLLRALAGVSFALLLAMVRPTWRPSLVRPLGLSMGLFWGALGLVSLVHGWAIPLRGGGFTSPRRHRGLWLVLCVGWMLIGCCCLLWSGRPGT